MTDRIHDELHHRELVAAVYAAAKNLLRDDHKAGSSTERLRLAVLAENIRAWEASK
jgi:hypothetical protein